jgi:hypothetical protein
MGYDQGSMSFTKPCSYPFHVNQVGWKSLLFPWGEGSVFYLLQKFHPRPYDYERLWNVIANGLPIAEGKSEVWIHPLITVC